MTWLNKIEKASTQASAMWNHILYNNQQGMTTANKFNDTTIGELLNKGQVRPATTVASASGHTSGSFRAE